MSIRILLKQLFVYLLMVVLVSLTARLGYGLPIQETAIFLLLVSVVFYLPGALIRDLCCSDNALSLGPIPKLAVALGTGLCFATVYMHLYYELDLPNWFGAILILGIVIAQTLLNYGRLQSTESSSQIKSKSDYSELLAISLLTTVLVLMLSMSHYQDITITGNNYYRYWDSLYTESIFHEGLINALDHEYPPQSIYLSGGIDFTHYHLGMHLQVQLIKTLSGIDTAKLIYFYFSSFYFFLIGVLGFSIAKMLGAGSTVALITGLLLFGSDFSFISGLLSSDDIPFPWLALHIPVVYSLFTYNGILPGLITFLCFFVYLIIMFRNENYRTFLVLLLITYSAYLTKSSMGVQIAAVSAFICFIASFKSDHRRWILASFGFLFVLGLMLFKQGLAENSTGGIPVTIQPFNMFNHVMQIYNLTDLGIYFAVPAYFCYLVLTLGPRYLGYHAITKLTINDFDPSARGIGWISLYLLVFILSGYVLSETIVIGFPGNEDNSTWFVIQSMFAAWFLVCIFLVRLNNTGSSSTTLLALLILLLAYPSTIQFLVLRSDTSSRRGYFDFSKPEKELVVVLNSIKRNSVVLHKANFNQPSLAANFAGKSVVFSGFYSFVSVDDEVTARVNEVNKFFSATVSVERMNKITEKYNVSHVLCEVEECAHVAEHPSMYRIFENERYRLFEIRAVTSEMRTEFPIKTNTLSGTSPR